MKPLGSVFGAAVAFSMCLPGSRAWAECTVVAGVSASTDLCEGILVTWPPVDGATTYSVWRTGHVPFVLGCDPSFVELVAVVKETEYLDVLSFGPVSYCYTVTTGECQRAPYPEIVGEMASTSITADIAVSPACPGSDAVVTVSAVGAPPFSYAWTVGGAPAP